MHKKVTIKDLASQLNLTPATISRALNDSYEIGQVTKERVWALAKELNYQPDRIASSLRSKRTKLVGVILPDISYFFNSSALKGIEEVLIPQGYRVIIFQTGESLAREMDNVKDLAAIHVDGIIASLSTETKDLNHFHENLPSDTSLVFIDRAPAEPQYLKVTIDNEKAAYTAVLHLLMEGKKKIVWLAGPAGLKIAEIRYQGYCAAHKVAGIPIDPDLVVRCDFSKGSAYAAIHQVVKEREGVDAIFCINDRLAIEALAAVNDHDKKVPEDIALMGFNNETFSSFLQPPLTTVSQPALEMGIEAATQLLKLMQRKKTIIKEYVFETELIERGSTILSKSRQSVSEVCVL
ncbi:LacI family DNA-binding transcriptional regulator [Rhabdobacter roseus]|uniref:DNA-binding LacI/PurR family transcriptional regulator n=1 Tax=Rhabdobacter roseus TaxID=1655419 RepID=A0A840THS3_9BACT|nr:LacI family DNA-binding transcriptional regulator [Rhabdobacter roseus]MBB5283706.1 DNA-binding LacI/PurR family transcriptional regulator [Rhabdobacter roseus]